LLIAVPLFTTIFIIFDFGRYAITAHYDDRDHSLNEPAARDWWRGR
jgi:hypothetical protein